MITSKPASLVDSLPCLSPLTMHMLRALSRPNCSVSELTDIAERDAALSARILRTANSATFGRLNPVHSVRHAISMQGVNLLRKFMLVASISSLFSRTKSSPLFSLVRFNLHSAATGAVLELLAEELPIEHADHAFVAGLLHDVGEMLIAVNLPQEYGQVLAMAAVTGESQVDCERKLLGIDHAELSSLAMRKWQLEDSLQAAVSRHHRGETQADSRQLKLSNALAGADRFVNSLGISALPPTAESLTPPLLEFPGFDFSSNRVCERFREEWSNLSEMFH